MMASEENLRDILRGMLWLSGIEKDSGEVCLKKFSMPMPAQEKRNEDDESSNRSPQVELLERPD